MNIVKERELRINYHQVSSAAVAVEKKINRVCHHNDVENLINRVCANYVCPLLKASKVYMVSQLSSFNDGVINSVSNSSYNYIHFIYAAIMLASKNNILFIPSLNWIAVYAKNASGMPHINTLIHTCCVFHVVIARIFIDLMVYYHHSKKGDDCMSEKICWALFLFHDDLSAVNSWLKGTKCFFKLFRFDPQHNQLHTT